MLRAYPDNIRSRISPGIFRRMHSRTSNRRNECIMHPATEATNESCIQQRTGIPEPEGFWYVCAESQQQPVGMMWCSCICVHFRGGSFAHRSSPIVRSRQTTALALAFKLVPSGCRHSMQLHCAKGAELPVSTSHMGVGVFLQARSGVTRVVATRDGERIRHQSPS